MNRRILLAGFISTPLALYQSPSASPSSSFASSWLTSFAAHWRDTEEYTLAVLDAMPADGFESKPHPVQRPFGDQLRHLAHANVVYFKSFGLVAVPAATLTTDREALDRYATPADKEAVRRFVLASLQYVSSVLDKITEADLRRQDLTLWEGSGSHSGTDICLRAYMHTAHHRGQAVVYLRVKGITPPAWKFEPTGH